MSRSAATDADRERNLRSTLFVAKFLAILIASYLLLSWAPVDRGVIEPFTAGIADASAVVLRALGQPITRTGTALVGGGGCAVNIRNGCNGVEASMFLVAAMLAFPAVWKWRLLGVAAGLVMIQILNLARVVTLYLLQCHKPDLFHTFHVAIWPAVIGGATIGLFYLWIGRAPRRA